MTLHIKPCVQAALEPFYRLGGTPTSCSSIREQALIQLLKGRKRIKFPFIGVFNPKIEAFTCPVE
jgi:hypothetical protein